ncbi:MAG: TRAP transporter substrate-binding protein DctP [Ectothiorhodospiraceae bacterium]|nr:TRAP transporter substrate-binding protein DctP [Chromatiales bacterium]MCP5155525.1 TRAP transporter substrate-binding protein DctP [Ectothiorhodospiraceae bacterium]
MNQTIRAASVAALLAVSASSVSAQTYNWRMATIDSETGVYFTKIAKPYAELVDKLTGGRMKIEPLPAGTVGNIFKLHEAVEDELVDMANWPPSFLGTADPTNAMITGFPTGLGTDAFHAWLYQGGGEKLLTEHRAATMKMHSFILGSGPSEWFAHSHVPIRTTADLKGLKYRTLGNWAAVVKDKFGAAPTTTPGSEVYGMLEKKGIDLAEYSMPAENFARGYHEIAKYVIYPGIHAPAWAFEGLIKQEKWDALPEDIKLAMHVAAQLVTYQSFMAIINDDLDAVVKIEKSGNEMIRLSPEFIADSRNAAREWAMGAAAEAKAKGNEWPEKVASSIFAFQDRWIAGSKYLVVDHHD